MLNNKRKWSYWVKIAAIGTLIGGAVALIGVLYNSNIIDNELQEKKDKPPQPQPKKEPEQGSSIGQYIDHGDGTITDTKTGLIWKRCAEGLSGDNCEHGKLEKYTWGEAMQRAKDVDYAGYSDWQLPSIEELKTLVYCSKGVDKYGSCNDGSKEPTINQQAFPNTEKWSYWSGTPIAYNSGSAWVVFFNYGNPFALNRSNDLAVRLVRNGQ
ncbi:MAG: DUF1566 domain-containing protein [Candidatus Electrothrix sp. AW2]|nr:DUF1566 domain-containing protein [Candidatus Electrothrix gigas]